MCGILGIPFPLPIANRNVFIVQRDTLRHRSPNDAGEWWSEDGRLGLRLRHRQLTIIDLSPASHQPMSDTRGSYTIVFNSEIYNYRELRDELTSPDHSSRTQSDTEVILEAYRR